MSKAGDSDSEISYLERFIAHEEFVKKNKSNDIALAKVKTAFKTTLSSSVAKLPRQDQQPEAKITAVISGWGSVKPGWKPSNFLQKMNLKIFTLEVCKRIRGSFVTDNNICAKTFDAIKGGPCDGELIIEITDRRCV